MNQKKIRNIIAETSEQYGFKESFKTNKTTDKVFEKVIKTVRKGVFKDENSYMGIVCSFVDIKTLGKEVESLLTNIRPIESTYLGVQYLLCLIDKKFYAYNIKYYEKLLDLINELEFEFNLDEPQLFVGEYDQNRKHALIMKTPIADFLVAGLIHDNQDEEERVILSNKLEASLPFFKFKAPIHFDWDNISGTSDLQFENICELLLQKEKNITKVIPIGKTRASDRGRDFEVTESIEGFNENIELRWLVQCKFSKNSISPATIAGWTDRIIEHNYDGFWLMTNNDITPNLFDQFKDVEKNKIFEIKTRFWQRSDFHIKLNVHSEIFANKKFFKNL